MFPDSSKEDHFYTFILTKRNFDKKNVRTYWKRKIGMTSVYSAEGKNIPCTVIEAGPCVVTQIRTVEKDSYEAVQIAYDDKK